MGSIPIEAYFTGRVAKLVSRPLSMRKVPGSKPGMSIFFLFSVLVSLRVSLISIFNGFLIFEASNFFNGRAKKKKKKKKKKMAAGDNTSHYFFIFLFFIFDSKKEGKGKKNQIK